MGSIGDVKSSITHGNFNMEDAEIAKGARLLAKKFEADEVNPFWQTPEGRACKRYNSPERRQKSANEATKAALAALACKPE